MPANRSSQRAISSGSSTAVTQCIRIPATRAWTRRALDRIGGLFELGGMGSGDHHMALGLVGAADSSMPGGVGAGYRAAVKVWESRMVAEINGKLGLVHSTIEHPFHGRERPIAATARAGRYS